MKRRRSCLKSVLRIDPDNRDIFRSRNVNLYPNFDAADGCLRCQFIYVSLELATYIHSFSSLCYDKSKASSKAARHTVRSRAFSFKWEYPLLSSRSSSGFLRLLPRLPVTSVPPFIFPSIIRCRRQFLRKMWPIQLVLQHYIHQNYIRKQIKGNKRCLGHSLWNITYSLDYLEA